MNPCSGDRSSLARPERVKVLLTTRGAVMAKFGPRASSSMLETRVPWLPAPSVVLSVRWWKPSTLIVVVTAKLLSAAMLPVPTSAPNSSVIWTVLPTCTSVTVPVMTMVGVLVAWNGLVRVMTGRMVSISTVTVLLTLTFPNRSNALATTVCRPSVPTGTKALKMPPGAPKLLSKAPPSTEKATPLLLLASTLVPMIRALVELDRMTGPLVICTTGAMLS